MYKASFICIYETGTDECFIDSSYMKHKKCPHETCVFSSPDAERQTDRQTDRQTEAKAERHKDRETETDRQTGRERERAPLRT